MVVYCKRKWGFPIQDVRVPPKDLLLLYFGIVSGGVKHVLLEREHDLPHPPAAILLCAYVCAYADRACASGFRVYTFVPRPTIVELLS